jgi:hypothetical protein
MPVAKSQDWQTPPALFDALDAEFGPFTCDPACNGSEHSAKVVLSRGGFLCWPEELKRIAATTDFAPATVGIDGLVSSWSGRVFLNPPYGRGMGKWIEKAWHEVHEGHAELVCALIPSRTDTRAWQDYILREVRHTHGWNYPKWRQETQMVRFLPGRVKFSGHKDPAPFPSAVVVWAGRPSCP